MGCLIRRTTTPSLMTDDRASHPGEHDHATSRHHELPNQRLDQLKLHGIWVWARPAELPGLAPGWRHHHPEACVVDAIERRSQRVWVPYPVRLVSMCWMGINSGPVERIQIWMLGRSSQQMDDEVRTRAS